MQPNSHFLKILLPFFVCFLDFSLMNDKVEKEGKKEEKKGEEGRKLY